MSGGARAGAPPVAFITGGAGGIGLATATLFTDAGYRVLLADVDQDGGRQAAADLGTRGPGAVFVATDVARSAEVAAAFARVLELWGRVDFVFNNAGITGRNARIDELDEDDFERVLAVNLKGPFFVCRHALPALRAGGGGLVLNVASITARTGSAYYPAYAAAKAGVIALTRSVARNSGRFNVRVNCLCPGSVLGTRLMQSSPDPPPSDPQSRREQAAALARKIPLGRAGRPDDVAHFALFLASPQARHVHGAILTLDGGESLGYH